MPWRACRRVAARVHQGHVASDIGHLDARRGRGRGEFRLEAEADSKIGAPQRGFRLVSGSPCPFGEAWVAVPRAALGGRMGLAREVDRKYEVGAPQ